MGTLPKFILVVLLFALAVPPVKAETKEQHTKVLLRAIGDEFLLSINDSTSRVLPIEKIEDRYAIQFEREFAFEPDLLLFCAFKVLEAKNIIDNYIVEVENCETKKVVHSFKASIKMDEDAPACKLRELPMGCYVFFFTLIEEKKEIAEPQALAVNTGMYYMYLFLGLILAVGVAYYIIKKRGSKQNPALISIGQYQFDQKGMLLILKAQSTELSTKEADLLYLLFTNENKTLEREYILNKVWDDEGDYIGRTLDVFISKLRKKLEKDDSVKIINVRGVGYRFVIN